MFNHKSFATGGLFPGLVTTRSIANLGAFEIEVIIEPPTPTPVTGGGGGYQRPIKAKYKIKIRVTRKNKVWNFESEVNDVTARVMAKILRVDLKKEPTVEVTSAKIKTNNPSVKVKIK